MKCIRTLTTYRAASIETLRPISGPLSPPGWTSLEQDEVDFLPFPCYSVFPTYSKICNSSVQVYIKPNNGCYFVFPEVINDAYQILRNDNKGHGNLILY